MSTEGQTAGRRPWRRLGPAYVVHAGQMVRRAARLMAEHRVGAVLVVHPSTGQIAGLFTERDLLIRVVAGGLDPDTTPIEEVMTRDVVTAGANESVPELITKMRRMRCRHLPVVVDGRPVGMLSLRDLMPLEALRDAEEGRGGEPPGSVATPSTFLLWRCVACGELHRGHAPPSTCASCGAGRPQELGRVG